MRQATRQSNFELLRIFSMFCIIVYHLLIFAIAPLHSDGIYRALQLPFHIGVPLFVMISGYFGIRFSFRGLVRLLSKAYIYFVPLAALPAVIMHQGFKEIVSNVFMIGFDKLWFLNTYLYLFLFAPVINKFLQDANKSQRIFLLAILTFMSIYIGNVTKGDAMLVGGKNLTNFLLLYVLGNTLSYYQLQIDKISTRKILVILIALNIFLVWGFAYGPSFLAGQIWKYAFEYNSPILLLNCTLCFILFSQLHFTSRKVNYIAGSIFACYLIQCPGLVWQNAFVLPVQFIDSYIHSSAAILLAAISLYAVLTMAIMIIIDKALSPLWNLFSLLGAKLDERYKVV